VLHAACPDLWMADNLNEVPWHTPKFDMRAVARSVAANRRTAVASCNGAGKSWIAARIAMSFLKTHYPAIVITTAPTARQVRRVLWREVHMAHDRARLHGIDLGGQLDTTQWLFGETHLMYGFSTSGYDPDMFQGLHGMWVLVIVDEAAGIKPNIWVGIMSVLRGANVHLLAIGNPTSVEGTFYEAFSDDRWATFHISAFDTPNLQGKGIVVPGLITPDDIEDARKDWGEGSPLWQSRILGQFPDVLEDTLIAITWVERAGGGDWAKDDIPEEDRRAPVQVGADFARFGSDENVFTARRGGYAFAGKSMGALDLGPTGTMRVVAALKEFALEHGARKMVLDEVGLGGGPVDRLIEMQMVGDFPSEIEIVPVNAGGKPKNPKRFKNLGAEMWWGMRERLKGELTYGPLYQNKRLLAHLTRRKYLVDSAGRIVLEDKETMKKRGLPSPDWGDSCAFAFAENVHGRAPIVGPAGDEQESRWRM
jgi:hypothetical protein